MSVLGEGRVDEMKQICSKVKGSFEGSPPRATVSCFKSHGFVFFGGSTGHSVLNIENIGSS